MGQVIPAHPLALDANRKLVKDREKAYGIAMSGLQSIDSLKATDRETAGNAQLQRRIPNPASCA